MKVFSVAAAVCAGLGAWCSLGALGLRSTGESLSRVGLLPPWWLLLILVVAAFLLIRHLDRSQVDPLFGLTLTILPWLPLPLPPAALLWTGPFAMAVWVIVGCAMTARSRRAVSARWLTDPRPAGRSAAALALIAYAAVTWWLSPILPDGDSPHYLMITQSLITDGDLRIENNHQQGEDLRYSLFAAEPHFQRRGVDGAIYSIHAPGVSVLVAPAVLLFGYPGAIGFLGLVTALSSGLVWRIGHRLTGSPAAAWFGWASGALTTPLLFQATQVFPDGIAATFVLLGALPLIAPAVRSDLRIWSIAGAALAVLPWLQTRLSIVSALTALCLLLHVRNRRQAVALALVPAMSAIAWFGYFAAIYGTLSPTAPYGMAGENTQTSLANLAAGFPGLFVDQQFGLFANAPVYAFIAAAVVVAAAKWNRQAWELLAIFVPYVVVVGMFRIWYGGTSTPVRLLAPFALVLGVAAAFAWRSVRMPATRTIGLMALAVSILIGLAMMVPDRGRLLLNARDGVALWLEWSHDVLDLPRGLPAIFRETPRIAVLKAAAWTAALFAGWLALRNADVRRERRGTATLPMSSLAILGLAASVMVAFSLSWIVGGASPLTPSSGELGLLRGSSSLRPLSYDYASWRFGPAPEALSRLHVATDRQRRPVSPEALLFAPHVPAGEYQVRVRPHDPGSHEAVLRVGTTPIPMWRISASDSGSAGFPVRFAADAESIVVESAEPQRRVAAEVELVPAGADRPPALAGLAGVGLARRAVPYGSLQAFFMDDHAYPEAGGFWVAGGRTAEVVIAGSGTEREVFLRNTPLDNSVVIDLDGERHELVLRPREETALRVRLQAAAADAVLRVRPRQGVRPSQLDSNSADKRYLGCWVEIR
jgi:hypothetical protein